MRRLGLAGILALALCSCQANVSDYQSGAAAPSPCITIAPADTTRLDPSAGSPHSHPEHDEAAVASVQAVPNEAPKPADSGDSPDEYPLQDNPLAGCSICHVDVEDEFVGTLHFKEKVGCSTCHGPSEGHLADENNEVKPDEVFARADVDRLCERCHECPRPVPERPDLTPDGLPKVCTDCHGPHDLALAEKTAPPNSP